MREVGSIIQKIFCLLFLAFAFLGRGNPALAEALKPLDAFEFEYATDTQISPDGKQVLYVRNSADIQTDDRISSVWLVDSDGGLPHPIGENQRSSRSPRWAPGGDRFAYVSDGKDGSRIIVRWLDGGDETVVAKLAAPPQDITWSPDGTLIAFAMLQPGAPLSFAAPLQKPAGAEWKPPAYVTEDMHYRFNGVGLFPAGAVHIFVVPADGGTVRRITPDGFRYGTGLIPGGIAWGHDSRELIVSANFGEGADLNPLDTELYAYPIDGSGGRKLTDRRGPDDQPKVSPDGSMIAYVGFDDRSVGYQNTNLYVMTRDGGNPRNITSRLDQSILDHQWDADGSGLYISYDREGITRLAHVTLDGGFEELQTDLGGGFGLSAYGGALGRGLFSVAAGGRYAFVHTDSGTPGDVMVGQAGSEAVKQLIDLNADLLRGKTLGRVETIKFQSSKDGQDIQGWLIYPPDFDPDKKYPLILEIHGGPFANYGPRFDLEKQLMAAHGYVVLYPNPRGSTSYGEAFGNAIDRNFPGDDYFDLMSGVDAALNRGFVDPNRLFVTGGSGGGLLTAWIIGKTDRFKAAGVHYPVIEWMSEALTSDAPAFMMKYWFSKMPWQDPKQFRVRSPLSLVQAVSTPTLVLVGEEDLRTPASQAEMYYMALKLHGVTAALVRIPDEPHGTAVHPSHQLAKVMNTLGWFDRYGGNPGD